MIGSPMFVDRKNSSVTPSADAASVGKLSSLSPANSLKDSSLETILPKTETFTHKSGSKFSWPARVNGDYRPSGRINSLFSKANCEVSHNRGGGFQTDLHLEYSFGTEIRSPSSAEIENFMAKVDAQQPNLDQGLRSQIASLTNDQGVFDVLKQFHADGGRFIAMEKGGHYNSDPLLIAVGVEVEPEKTRKTTYHELQHYVSDKLDSLFEVPDEGGRDHIVTPVLEDRYSITRSFGSGEIPLDRDGPGMVGILNGFLKSGPVIDKIEKYLDNNNPEGLASYAASEECYTQLVQSGMVSPVSSREYSLKHNEPQPVTIANLQDVAHQNAYNASMLTEALRLGSSLAIDQEISVKDAVASAEFRSGFKKFTKRFAAAMEADRTRSVRETGREILNEILETSGGVVAQGSNRKNKL
jgi:hypothetical protein